jgi:hypothetical protein
MNSEDALKNMTQKSSNEEVDFNSNELNSKVDLNNLKAQSSSLIKIVDKNDMARVKIFGFLICREYLSGAWKDLELEDFIIEKVS